MRIHETLGENSWGFVGIHKDSQDFGRGFVGICETLGEDLQGFARLLERIHETLGEDL